MNQFLQFLRNNPVLVIAVVVTVFGWISKAVKEQKARADDTSRPEPARKASAKRAEELGQARASIDALAERAKVGLEQADARIQQLTKDYDAKLSELSQKLPTGKK